MMNSILQNNIPSATVDQQQRIFLTPFPKSICTSSLPPGEANLYFYGIRVTPSFLDSRGVERISPDVQAECHNILKALSSIGFVSKRELVTEIEKEVFESVFQLRLSGLSSLGLQFLPLETPKNSSALLHDIETFHASMLILLTDDSSQHDSLSSKYINTECEREQHEDFWLKCFPLPTAAVVASTDHQLLEEHDVYGSTEALRVDKHWWHDDAYLAHFLHKCAKECSSLAANMRLLRRLLSRKGCDAANNKFVTAATDDDELLCGCAAGAQQEEYEPGSLFVDSLHLTIYTLLSSSEAVSIADEESNNTTSSSGSNCSSTSNGKTKTLFSHTDFGRSETFGDYYRRKRPDSIAIVDKLESHIGHHLLPVRQVSPRVEALDTISTHALRTRPKSKVHYIVPEFCVLVGHIRWIHFATIVPSVLHRLLSVLSACELRNALRAKLLFSTLGKALVDHAVPSANTCLQAMTPRKAGECFDNERLEMRGDTVLKYLTSVHLFNKYPHRAEGFLTAKKCKIVSNDFLAAKMMNVPNILGLYRFFYCSLTSSPAASSASEMKQVKGDVATVHNAAMNGVSVAMTVLSGYLKERGKEVDVGHHKVLDKTDASVGTRRLGLLVDVENSKRLADFAEALIGAFEVTGGVNAASLFICDVLKLWDGGDSRDDDDDDDTADCMDGYNNNTPHGSNFDDHVVSSSISSNIRTSGLYGSDTEYQSVKHSMIESLERILGYTFNNKRLLVQALTTRANAASTSSSYVKCYERLEFLGDAVLDMIIVGHLFDTTTVDEGYMSSLKSCFSCNSYLFSVANSIGLQHYIHVFNRHLLRGDFSTSAMKSTMSDVIESILGAMYLDSGKSLAAVAICVERFHLLRQGVSLPLFQDLQESNNVIAYNLPDTIRAIVRREQEVVLWETALTSNDRTISGTTGAAAAAATTDETAELNTISSNATCSVSVVAKTPVVVASYTSMLHELIQKRLKVLSSSSSSTTSTRIANAVRYDIETSGPYHARLFQCSISILQPGILGEIMETLNSTAAAADDDGSTIDDVHVTLTVGDETSSVHRKQGTAVVVVTGCAKKTKKEAKQSACRALLSQCDLAK